MTYTIRSARADDIHALPKIEQAADAAHFAGILENALRLPVDTPEQLEAARQAGRLWVAADETDSPVGYCFVRSIGITPHIEEVSVHPDHGRRGVGRRLVETALAGARDAGHSQVTLTTFRELPWNGPFYASMGFTEMPRAQVSAAYRALLEEEEAEMHRDPAYSEPLTRVLMMCDLTPVK